jgi:hypothetical protein
LYMCNMVCMCDVHVCELHLHTWLECARNFSHYKYNATGPAAGSLEPVRACCGGGVAGVE